MDAAAARKARRETEGVASTALTGLVLIAVAALAVRVAWLLWHGPGEIGWDGAEYARVATNIAGGHGYTGIRGTTMFVFPPFYSLTIAALLPLTADAARAGIAVSLLSGAAFVFPMFGIASICYGRRAGYAAAVLAAVLPFAVQLSTVVLADMLFLTLAATGLFFVLRTVDARRIADAIACGVAFALAYLTRPEGLLLAVLAVAIVPALLFSQPAGRGRVIVLALAIALPFAVLAAPYAAFLSSHAGHLRVEGKSILNLDIGLRMDRGLSYAVAADAIDDQLNEVGPELRQDYYFDPAGRSAPSLSAILTFGLKNSLRHTSEIARVAASRVCGTIVLLALAVLGFFAGTWNRRRAGNQAILIAYGIVVTVGLASVYHFWERYFVGYVPLLAVWGANGIDVVAGAIAQRTTQRWAKLVPLAVMGLLLVAVAFSTKTGFTDDDGNSLAERQAGTWLAQHGGAGARILSISDQSVYYANGVWWMLPTVPDNGTALRYVRKLQPDFIVLDRDYAAERPYVTAWLAAGVPDPAARVVYTLGDRSAPTIDVVKWGTTSK